MEWFTPRRSRSLAGSHGRSSKALLASRVRAVLLLLAMVAALAPRAFAQTTPDPVRWTNPGPNPAGAANWAQLGVGTTSLTGKLTLQQSVTLTRAGGVQWRHAGVSACPWTRVTPTPTFPPTTGCQTLKAEGASSGGGASITLPGFVPTQAMIDNGGVVIRVTWNLYSSNVVMTQWVPLVPPPNAALVLTPASISENAGVSTVTATLDRTTSAATTITVSAAAVAPAASGDFALSSATELTIAAGATTSTGTVTITANDNDVDAPDKSVTVSGAATGDVVEDPPDVTLTLEDDDAVEFAETAPERLVFTVDGAITPLVLPLVKEGTANPPITYALTPAVLPPGLAFDETSRTLSGTPTEAFAATEYVWTATDRDGDRSELRFAIEVEHGEVEHGEVEHGEVEHGLKLVLMPASISENAGVSTVTATLNRTTSAATTITVSAAAAAPAVSGDFALSSTRTLTIAAGATTSTGTVTITANDNDVDAPDKSVTVSGTATGEVVEDPPDVTLTLEDDDTDTRPAFDATTLPPLAFKVDKAIDPVTLPAATGGDGTLRYALTPALPPGLAFDKMSRTLSGTPTEALDRTTYSWTATDRDGDETKPPLTFTIEVEHGPEKARTRLKAISESVLPELSRALWGSAMDAVTGRLESPDAAAPTAAGGLEAAAGFIRAHESALDEGDVSWKDLLGGESFAFGLAEGGPGFGGVVAWGSGDWRRLSRDEDALDWSGDAFSAHVGADAALRPGLRAGLAASWFASDVDYTDRSQGEAITGSHESRMTSLTPYVGWDGGDGTRLWGAAGYGQGEIEIVDEELRERFGAQKADSRFLAGAAGGSARVWSEGALTVDAKASGEATRFEAKDNGSALAGVTAETRRLRVAAEGSRAWALADGASLTPTLEAGVRWDGGDGATGAGLEAGGGLSWSDPSRGLTVEATGRALLVHNSDVEEWGASGSMRLAPDADGLGLSFRLLPSWGVPGSGVARLWNEGVAAARPADVGGGNRARLETELGYGLPAFAGAGVTTPYAGVGLAQGGERDMRAGVRVGLGAGFDLGIETARRETTANTGHGIGFDLRIRW